MSKGERRAPSLADTARQFSEHARQYAVSRLHLEGATRMMLIEHMEPIADEVFLDVGSGPGPLALAFAPLVERAIAFDVSPAMLRAATLAARRAEAGNVRFVAGDVHRLPILDRSIDLVASRACPHHFADIRTAMGEMARVLKRGGRLGIADGTVPEDDEIDMFINALDVLHDPTTVRNYRPTEWRSFCEGAGLRVDFLEPQAYEMAEPSSLADWLARSGASSAVFEESRRMLLEAPARVRDYLRVSELEGDDLGFHLPRVVLVAKKVD